MSHFNQIEERRRATSLRPIGILALEPTDLAKRYGLRFNVDERESSTAALLETRAGHQYLLLRHFDALLPGTEVLASEVSNDPECDLADLLQALDLDPQHVIWKLDRGEARASELERRQLQTARAETQSERIILATGEALTGDGNELAHIDLLIGSKTGPVGKAFAAAFVNEKEGHTNLLAVVTPNLPAKPDTVISNKVTIKGEKQSMQLFGPAQAAVARAVVDSVAEGVIPKDQVDDLCLIVGVFIHWEATDDKKIYDYNYEAVKMSIARALNGDPSVDKVLAETPAARHPFAIGTEG